MRAENLKKNDWSMNEIGYNILTLRTSMGWNQREMAQKAALSIPYVSKLENGRTSNISLRHAYALYRAFQPYYKISFEDFCFKRLP